MKKILIGKIISVFGIKGEVKIISYAADPRKIEKYPLFDEKGNSIKIKISNKNKTVIGTNASGEAILIAKIDGISDRTTAEKLRGAEIFADRKDFDGTSDDEFYYVDLINLDVLDMESKKIGRVANVFDHGAGGIIEIEFNEADPKKNREKIENFPFKNQIFPEVNLKAGFIRIDMPEIVKDGEK
jgi:16S rRNA processing protein RimM